MTREVVGSNSEPVGLVANQTGVQAACRIRGRHCRIAIIVMVAVFGVDVGIDDYPAVFGRRQIGAGRGLQFVAE